MHPVLINVIYWVKVVIEFIVDTVAKLVYDGKKETLPALTKEELVLLNSVTKLAELIRTRKLKSEELVRLCVNRIRKVNPIVNAVTDERYIEAIDEAREIDIMIEKGLSDEEFKKKPFLGVPFTTKDSSAAKGMLHTLGLVSRKREKAAEDSECVRVMKEAGCILVAMSNIPEVNKWQESRNMLYGQTNNPYHTGRTVGGSSGGEAALVSSIASPIGLCSDIGGSTRMPAFYCGLFGHNPTGGITNMRGTTFRTGLEKTIASTGIIAKHAEDLVPLMELLTAERGKHLKLSDPVDIKKLNYFYVRSAGDITCSEVKPDLQNAMSRVIENLKNTVATNNPPKEIKNEGFKYMYKLWKYWVVSETTDFAFILGNYKKSVSGIKEAIKKLFGCSDFSLAAIIALLDLQILPQVNEEWAKKTTENLKNDLLKLLGKDGILLYHSTTHPAPYHYTCFSRPYNFAYWGIFNVLQFPATQVPLGLNSEGIPLGIQVVSAPGNDRLTLAVAKHLEKEFGGFVPPCTVPN